MNKELSKLNEQIQVIKNSVQHSPIAKTKAVEMEASLNEIMKIMGLPRMHTNRKVIPTDIILICDEIKPIVKRLSHNNELCFMNLDLFMKDIYISLVHIKYVI